MAKFREEIVATNNRNFVHNCLNDNLRIGDRAFDEFRPLRIEFGSSWGSALVSLGDTRVLAQVSCQVQAPKSSRPSEGILYVNLELNPIAAPHFEVGRQTDQSVLLNRMLEKCIKDSKAVDLESLCIKVNEKVWALRVDCNVLNYEGNIADCASIAALAALSHFRRPDVTCDGEEVIIHSYSQRDSIPTVLHHYPVCVSYAIYTHGKYIIADPELLEEQVAEAHIMIGINSLKELCGFHLGGSAMMSQEDILSVTQRAGVRATFVINEIKDALSQDLAIRSASESNVSPGFTQSYLYEQEPLEDMMEASSDEDGPWELVPAPRKRKQHAERQEHDGNEVIDNFQSNSAALVPSHSSDNQWQLQIDIADDDEDDEADGLEFIPEKQPEEVLPSDGSEEEVSTVLNADEKTNKHRKRRK